MTQLTDIQRFRIARTRFNESVEEVAARFGYSSRYIYDVLKYPNKNRDLYQRISDYITRADINVDQPQA